MALSTDIAINANQCRITDNLCLNNSIGISLYESSNNIIKNNNITDNFFGIRLYNSNNNLIYLNNFINSKNVYSFASTNMWNSPGKITYQYSDKIFTNYLGNYWNDYNEDKLSFDPGGDLPPYDMPTDDYLVENGVGDTPYTTTDSDKDYYPLMKPFENYFVLEEKRKFDPAIDGFSFTNSDFGRWARENGLCTDISIEDIIGHYNANPLPFKVPTLFYWFLYLSGKKSHEGGHCYGMAAASLDYYLHPEKIPNGKKVSELSKEEAAEDIEYWQTHWIFDIDTVTKGLQLTLGFVSLKDEYQAAKRSIDEGKPVILAMFHGMVRHGSFWTPVYHNVVEYNYKETDEKIEGYIYDSNYRLEERVINKTWKNGELKMNYTSAGYDFKSFVSLGSAVDYSIWDNMLYILVRCPVELHVYDSQGNHIGLTPEGVETGFPALYIHDEEGELALIPGHEGNYTIEIVGTGEGTYNLSIAAVFDGTIVVEKNISGKVFPDATYNYKISISPAEIVVEETTDTAQTTPVPEFTTILIPVLIIFGLFQLMRWA